MIDGCEKCAAKFLERVSFDQNYIKNVENYRKKKRDINFSNQIKEIRNRKK